MFLEKGQSLIGTFTLRNAADGRTIARTVEMAVTRGTRRRGLLGRTGLAPDHALLIAPCSSIHTWFMRFPIDVIFMARDGRVLKIRRAIPAWRMSASWGAYAVVEMASGAIARTGVTTADRLELVER